MLANTITDNSAIAYQPLDHTYAAIRLSETYLGHGVTESEIEYLAYDESAERWYMTTDGNGRWEFESKADAEQAILNFGDDYMAAIPVADKPLSPAAIESAQWLADELSNIISNVRDLNNR